jgi:Zn-dependent protease
LEYNSIENGLLWFLAFLLSTTVHEAAHAFVAWRGGDPTAYRGGQVSLSPIPHIRREPIGMLVVPLVTAMTRGWAIGWASTPYDPQWEARYPKRAALMAAAGPAGNLAIALIAFLGIKFGLAAGWFTAPHSVTFEHLVGAAEQTTAIVYAGKILSIFLMLNVLLFAFNLLPFPPLDGGSAIGLVLPEAAASRLRELSRTGALSMVGFLIAWVAFPYIARPLFDFVLFALYPGMVYT